jgi:hypothetical protein
MAGIHPLAFEAGRLARREQKKRDAQAADLDDQQEKHGEHMAEEHLSPGVATSRVPHPREDEYNRHYRPLQSPLFPAAGR